MHVAIFQMHRAGKYRQLVWDRVGIFGIKSRIGLQNGPESGLVLGKGFQSPSSTPLTKFFRDPPPGTYNNWQKNQTTKKQIT